MKKILTLFLILSVVFGCSSTEYVEIPDENLATAIREALKLRPNSRIPKLKLAELTELTAPRKGIKDLSGLENAAELTKIELYGNQISDITPLANLKKLTNITIGGNQISNITALGNISQLTTLHLYGNEISDISPLTQLKELKVISISGDKVSDISSLSEMTQLTELYLGNSNISDLTPLSKLTQLTDLSLTNSKISDITPLSGLTHLTSLNLTNNQISDITPLSGMVKLRLLQLDNNQIEDISALEGMTIMNILIIGNNKITDITPLSNMLHPYNFVLTNNRITDISPLARIKDLRHLNLSGNQVRDITPLAELTILMALKLDNNNISDMSGIENLQRLERLDIKNNPIEDFTSIRRLMRERSWLVIDIDIPPIETDDNTRAALFPEAIRRLGKGGINTMRFSPDSSSLAVGTSIGAWVYDIATGNEKIMSMVYPRQVNALAFSPDGKILVSSGYGNNIIQFWNPKTGTEISSLRPSTEEKHRFSAARFNYASNVGLAFSEDGTTLLGVNTLDSIAIAHWDVKTGDELAKHRSLGQATTAAIHSDTNTLALGRYNGKISLWNSETGKKLDVLNGHSKFYIKAFLANLFKKHNRHKYRGIQALAFSTDGKILASSGIDNLVKLWDVKSRQEQKTLIGHTEWVTALGFSMDDSTVASGDIYGNIKLWDVSSGSEQASFNGHRSNVSVLTFSPDRRTLASASDDGTIKFWDANTGQSISTIATKHTRWVKSMAFSEDDTTLSSVMFNGTVQEWDVKTGQEVSVSVPENLNLTYATALSTQATLFAAQNADGKIVFNRIKPGHLRFYRYGNRITLLDLESGESLPSLTLEERNLNVNMAFSPTTEILACVDGWQDVRLYDVRTGKELFKLDVQIHSGTDAKLVFSPDGTMLAINGKHFRPTHVWNVEKREKLATLPEGDEVLAFSRDSTMLATKGDMIAIWEITPSKEVLPINEFEAEGEEDHLLFSPEGHILLTVDRDETLLLWDIEMASKLLSLSLAHTTYITSLVFSHDGLTLASSSKDGTVILWDWNKILAKIKPDDR